MTNFDDVQVIILAAGKGTRMRSAIPKVLHLLNEIPMIHYVLEVVNQISPADIHIIVGYQKDEVIHSTNEWKQASHARIPIKFVTQEEQLGTGHAVLCAKDYIDKNAHVLILLGDVPLIREESLIQARQALSSENVGLVVLTTEVDEPRGYGRIIRDTTGEFHSIKEEKEVDVLEARIQEINTGIFFFSGKFLWNYIHQLRPNKQSGELYLTDMVSLIRQEGYRVIALNIKDHQQFLGINSPEQLARIEKKRNEQKILSITNK